MSKTGQAYSPVLSHQLWTVCISRQSDVHTKQRVPSDAELLSRGRDYPGEDMDAPIESNRRRTLIEEHARHYRYPASIVTPTIRYVTWQVGP